MTERYTASVPTGATRRLLTTTDYHAMIEAGILGPDDRVELLAGELYEAAAINSPHAACVRRLTRWFSQAVGERALVNVQNPVEISDFSEPQPDLSLLAPRADFYAERHPRPEEVLLVIEVVDSSWRRDRHLKLPLYAQAGIAEVWLIALRTERVHVFREPAGNGYAHTEQVGRGGTLSPRLLPDLELKVDAILG